MARSMVFHQRHAPHWVFPADSRRGRSADAAHGRHLQGLTWFEAPCGWSERTPAAEAYGLLNPEPTGAAA